MSAPTSAHQAAQRRAKLIIEREYQPDPSRCVAAIVKLLTYQAPAHRATITDSADDRRPLGAGARPSMHNEDHVSALQERDVAFEEDGRHEPTDA